MTTAPNFGLESEIRDLTRDEYERVRKLVYEVAGINLGTEKMQLVRARLGKRVRQGRFKSFTEYFDHVQDDRSGEELCRLLDAISTNTTHLFREIRHFELLKQFINNLLSGRSAPRTLRIWSAACSSGEEPHSIAMVALDALQNHRGVELKILATDISIQMLARAKQGLYESHRVGTVPAELRSRYLRKAGVKGQMMLQVAPEIQKAITFSRFNLMAPSFPFKHGFDVVFCRNVMIYFDRPTQQTLVGKIAAHLHSGGHLLIGHSESLNGIQHPLTYVEPTVYRK